MYSMRTSCTGSARLFQAAALLIAMAAHSSAQSAGAIRITQSAPGYVAGATLTVSCEIGVDAGRQVQSLLWRPLLPSAWTLTGTVTGDGDPMLDPDGDGILFLGGDLTAPNPLVIQYHVAVPAGETGARILGGALEYQLDGMANPAWAGSDPLTLTDFDAAQESLGYLAGTRMTVTCTVSHPEGVALQSLLWRPSFPSENWTLVGAGEVTPGAAPEVDSDGEYVVLLGDISANPLAFTYTVLVPPDTAGEQEIRGRVEYQLTGMPNPAIAWAEPDPLVLQAMHTLEIVSPYGAPLPGAGLYTNFYGTLLTNAVNPAVTADNLDWGCAGWILSNHAPASGTGTNCLFTLTNNAVLSWIWVAPQVGNRTVTELETLAFQSSVAYTNDGFEPLHLLYTLDADSQSTGLAITADGAFSWTPNEAQGDASYTVTVTVTDNGAEPHWLTAAETFTITVVETNRPPVLEPISGQLADEQSTLTFTALASDPDLPAQALTFTLDPASLNAGMTIDAASGVFTWSPAPGQAAADPYTVTVTVTDNGLNPSALSASRTFSIGVVDSRATHASDGYLAGRTAEIHCTFEHPGDKALLSLLWRPLLPDGWALLGVDGQGDPAIDTGDGAMIFIGDDLNTPNPLAFTYWIAVPDGVTGPREIRAEAEYLVTGKSNPLTIRVNPEPLVLREMHTVEIVSAEGQCVPPVGIYTNWHGTNLSATVSTPLTAGTRTFACTGWTLAETNLAAVAGASAEVFWTLTNDVVLTWNWVAPLIEPTNVFTVAMDEDGIWQAPAISASEPYRPALVDQLNWTLLTAPTNGAATVEGTGAIPTIVYTPALDWYGTDRFTVQVADGLGGFDQATIIVVVNPVNDPPVLAPIGDRQTDEFTPLAFTVSATDVDIPVQNLTYTISGAPANAMFDTATGDFSWVPEAGEAGAEGATFTVTITVTDDGLSPDNQSDSETFTLTLLPVRATHSTIGYVPGELLAVDCQFDYPAGRVLQSLLWRPELPEGWTLTGVAEVSPGTAPEGDPDDGAILLLGSLDANPLQFRYIVQVPAGDSGTNSIGGLIEYQLDGMPNPGKVRAQPDPLIIPMLLKLPGLVVADKIYDGFTNATVAAYGDLAGIMDGHDVSLVTTGVVAWFDTPHVGSNAVVVSGFVLDGADAAWYAIDTHVVTAAIAQATLTVAADPQTKVYGDDNPPLTFQYSGFVNGEDMTVLDTVPAVGTTVTVATAVGVYTNAITVSGAVDNNYAFTYVPADFTITPKPVTVTADAQTKVYGAVDPALTYSVAPALVEGDAFTGALSRAAGEDVGTYAIGQGTLALNGNYALTVTGADFTITKATPVITSWPVASSIQLGQTLGDALLSGGEANVPGTFAFDNPGDAPGSGTTAHAVTFTPTDTLNFTAVTGSIPVTVFAEPTLAEIAAQTVDELTLLTFQATVTNPDQLAGELAYSLDVASLAAGMAIDEQTGLFSWIPSELQGPGEYAVTLTVADGAGSAPAVTPLVSESFEGLPLGSSIDGVNGWQGDGATVVNDPSGPAGYLVDLPLPGDHTQTLQVTESVTLITNATGITTLDLMLRPEPVDALPEMPPDAQSAFAFNTDGDLLIYHSTNTLAGFAPGWSTMTLADKVTSGEWVRLMIVTDYITSDPPNPMFQISIDGTPVSSPLARQTADIDGTADGTWFIAAAGATVGGGASQFNALNIQGSGVLDDVVLQSATSGGGAGSGGGGLSDSVTFTITVNEVNQAPVAHDDGFTVAEGGQLDIPVPGVLANDTDADFPTNTLSAVLLAGTGNGDLTLDADGSFTYTHNGGETTSDSFTYSVFDGLSNSAPATVAIAVTPVNDAPFVATPLPDLVRLPNFDPFTVELGGVFTDPEGDPFVLNVVLAGEGAGAYLTGSTLTVTNFADAGGLLSIEVQATETLTDPRLIGTTSFTLTVAPVCNLTQNKGYGSIQAALDDAQTNDSIVVASGTYPGNFIVATPVVLTGSGEGQTILDGGGTGSVVAVLADQTTISGFTIEHSGGTAGDAGILLDGVSGCSVTGNTIQSAVIGIHVVGASGNEMAGNTVTNNVTGVLVDAGWQDEVWMQSEANGFTANNLSGNASASMQYGTEQTAGTQAISNWWGAADGPSGAGQGTGGAVAEGVVFTPWYTDAALSNLVPYDLRLDNTSIVENAPIGSEVGRFIVNDDDAGDVQVFRLASGNGTNDVDNACFSVNGASLLTSVELNYPSKAFYRIFAEVDDGRGGTNWAAIVVSVENVNDAPVAGAIHLVAVAGHSLAFDAAAYCQDLDGDTLTVTVSDPPAGLDTARADGLLAYLGTQADVGTLVTFAYTVSDGQLSAQGTVDIEVVATIEDYLSKALAITRIVPVSGEAAASCVLHFPAIWTEDGAVTYEVLQRPDFLTGDWTVATDSTLTFMPTADGFYGVMHALVPVPSGASRMFFKVQATVGGL